MRALLLPLCACGRIGFASGDSDVIADSPDAEPGLVVWYRMEDDVSGGRLEDSAGANQPALCVVGSTCGTPTPGPINQGLLLDGDTQFYRLASDPSLVTPAAYTIAFWARLDAIDPENLYTITKRYDTIYNSWGYFIDEVSGDAIFETVHEPGPSPDHQKIAATPSLGTWVHYAMTWDDTTKRAFVNGVKLLDFPISDVTFDDSDIVIGADEDNGNVYGFWPGALDEVRIYDRVLSDLEIQQLSQL